MRTRRGLGAGVHRVALRPGFDRVGPRERLFDERGRVEFPRLPAGSYRVLVEARGGDIAVGVQPSRSDVECSGGGAVEVLIELR